MLKSKASRWLAGPYLLWMGIFIVVPLTYLFPYAFHFGTAGVFMAEPVSNVIGGSICFITMLCTVIPELRKMEAENEKL